MAELVETPQAHDQGRKGRGRCAGTVQSRDGEATCWSSPLLAAPTAPLPQVCQGQRACTGAVVTLYYNPDDPAEMYVEGDKSVLGAEVLYVVLGIVLLVLMAGIGPLRRGRRK